MPSVQENLLQEGIAAAKAAQKKGSTKSAAQKDELRERARQLLIQVTEYDPANISAWLWLSTVVSDPADKLTCLNNVQALDPENPSAERGLALLGKQHPDLEELSAEIEVEQHPVVLPPEENRTNCPFCNAIISKMDSPCPHCRTPLVMGCPACNTIMDVEWENCTQCGFNMGDYQLRSVYFTHLATAYREYHRLSKALEALRVAEQLNPDQPDLYRQMGEILGEMSEPAAAITTLEEAVKREPEQVGPYLALGKVLQQEGRWERAERVYNDARRVAPKSSEVYYALGDLLLHQSRNLEAQKNLKKATRIDPYHGQAWARLGQSHEIDKKYHSAISAYRRAIKLLPRGGEDWQLVQERLRILDPQLPEKVARSWSKLIQYLAIPVLILVGAALLESRFQPQAIPPIGWISIFLGIVGAWMWASGYVLPKNPPMRLITGNRHGIAESDYRQIISLLGGAFWLAAVAINLLPLV